MLKDGERAPEFSLPDQNGRDISLTSLLNVGAVILWFFSGLPSPIATRTARKFGELYDDLMRQGLVVAAISPRTPSQHRRLRERYQLPFVLLSDVQKSVAHMYQCTGLFGIRRGTYLISRGRVILGSEDDLIRVGPHLAFVRKAAKVVQETPLQF